MDPLSLTYAIGAGHNRTHVRQNFDDISAWANGLGVDTDDLDSADASILGLSQAGTIRRGQTSIATSETRAVGTYGTLATPDQVVNVVLPANGLIAVAYQAVWHGTTASAAIFIGSNQLQQGRGTGAPTVQEASVSEADDGILFTDGNGLNHEGGGGASSEVTTGQSLGSATTSGGPCYIFAAAGTYTVSVQFKAATVTVKNRHLWVWTLGF